MSIFKKLGSYLFLIFSIVLIINLSKDAIRLSSADKRIEEAEIKLAKLKQENQEFKNKLEYYQGDEFAEEEIRNKLQLTKPGEKIVILPEQLKESLNQEEDIKLKPEETPIPNWQKWLNLFL
jgi:cell division protein FtsB